MTMSEQQIGGILALFHKCKWSFRRIAAAMQISKNTVVAVVQTYSEAGERVADQRRRIRNSDSQKKIRARQAMAKRYAKCTFKVNSRTFVKHGSARRIREAMLVDKKNPTNVSVRTIQRDLNNSGLKCIVRRKCSSLKPVHVQARLNFARTFRRRYNRSYARWRANTDIYKHIIFSDEHNITANDHSSRQMWVESRKHLIPREVSNPFNTRRIMIWGAIGYNYKSPLVVYNINEIDPNTDKRVTQTQDAYHRRCLIGSGVIQYCANNNMIYMQDGSRTHTATKCKMYIASKGVKLIDNWPAHTPRLNPIEKLWSHLDRVVADMTPAMTVEALIANVKTAWDALSHSTVNQFVMTFENGLRECRAANGQY